jgi:hypothetical protein
VTKPLPTAEIHAGTVLTRVHWAGNDPLYFGRRDKSWRWDAPDGSYGVLYVGREPVGPFAETLLRDPTQRDIFWSDIDARRLATFLVKRPLIVAQLHGKGLAWFGIQSTDIAEHFDPKTHPEGYAKPQEISGLVHVHPNIDGIQYRSRFDNDELCLAIFDRASVALELQSRDTLINRRWAYRILEERGYSLIDL